MFSIMQFSILGLSMSVFRINGATTTRQKRGFFWSGPGREDLETCGGVLRINGNPDTSFNPTAVSESGKREYHIFKTSVHLDQGRYPYFWWGCRGFKDEGNRSEIKGNYEDGQEICLMVWNEDSSFPFIHTWGWRIQNEKECKSKCQPDSDEI
eukprot:Pgem_evm1s20088